MIYPQRYFAPFVDCRTITAATTAARMYHGLEIAGTENRVNSARRMLQWCATARYNILGVFDFGSTLLDFRSKHP